MLAATGYCHFAGALSAEVERLEQLLSPHDRRSAGERIPPDPALAQWLNESEALRRVLEESGSRDAKPVRMILFDKSPKANWSLGWHQDRTVCVKQRADIPGYGPFSTKGGLTHVEPPFEIIESMRTLRIHLDPVDASNGALQVAEGTHLMGRIPTSEIAEAVSRSSIVRCDAQRGDLWGYATPILHASERSTSAARRRVLQIDYSPSTLPRPLEWLGLAA